MLLMSWFNLFLSGSCKIVRPSYTSSFLLFPHLLIVRPMRCYDVPRYYRFQKSALPFFSGRFRFSDILSAINQHQAFSWYYITLLTIWTRSIFRWTCVSIFKLRPILTWYPTGCTMSIFNRFMVLLSFDEAAECVTPILLFISMLWREVSVPALFDVGPFSL